MNSETKLDFSSSDFEKNKPLNRQPKMELVEFLKSTMGENLTYTFTFAGTKNNAEKYIHAMRVELSRLRSKAIAARQIPNPFKIIKKSVKQNGNSGECVVTLLRQKEKPVKNIPQDLLDSFCETSSDKKES